MTERYKEYLTEKMSALTKEQLVWMLIQCEQSDALITETLVEASKMHISPEDALQEIRKYLGENHLHNIMWSHKAEDLQAVIDFKMGKISRKECRKRLGLD